MRVLFRTGGDRRVGFGHIRRCLSLAEALRHLGAESLFLLEGETAIIEQVTRLGFKALRLRPEMDDLLETTRQARSYYAQIIVTDFYTFQGDYFRSLNETGALIVAIDDLADREFPVHVVVNGALNAERLAYHGWPETIYLLGSQYALLRQEFAEVPQRKIADKAQRTLITMGGSDPYNLTPRLIRWAVEALGTIKLDVVIGPLFENIGAIEAERQIYSDEAALHYNPENIRALMLAADLAICGGGQTIYELASTGTAALGIGLVDNQLINLKGFAEAGALIWVGNVSAFNLEAQVIHTLSLLAADSVRRAKMSAAGRALVDGRGAGRVAQAILERTEKVQR